MKLTPRAVLNTFALTAAGALTYPLKSIFAEASLQAEPLIDSLLHHPTLLRPPG
jgi:hypothetical protein